MLYLLQFISDYNGEDRFMTRIGVGGLLNMDKLKQAHVVLSDIALFHSHGQRRREEDDHRYYLNAMHETLRGWDNERCPQVRS